MDYQVWQAVELIRALHGQVDEMATESARLEWLAVGTSRLSEFSLEATALRRDTQRAQDHIDRLQRRYLKRP